MLRSTGVSARKENPTDCLRFIVLFLVTIINLKAVGGTTVFIG